MGSFCQSALVYAYDHHGDPITVALAIRSDRRDATLVRTVVVQARCLEHLCAYSSTWHGERQA